MKTISDLTRINSHMTKTINKKSNECLLLRDEVKILRRELKEVRRSYSDHVKRTAELRQAVDRLSAEKSKWLRRKDT